MQKLYKKLITKYLAIMARVLLWRKKPKIIAVTGSAGKTSTVRFLSQILSYDFEVLQPIEGYNTEIGAVLNLFSEKNPEKIRSVISWLKVMISVFKKAFFIKDFPEKVVIEMGADKPGDIKYLCKIFKPDIGVILRVLPVHLVEFKSIHAIAQEKSELAKSIGKDGKVFLNWDDLEVRRMATLSHGEVIFFGTQNKEGLLFKVGESNLSGTRVGIFYNGQKENVRVRIYGKHMIYPLMASVAVSLSEGTTLKKIISILKKLHPYKGRMNLIEGRNNSLIIDDSYNANPDSTIKALDFLKEQKGRKIALLGSMNELSDYEKEGHEKVGAYVPNCADLLYTVGETANKYLASAAIKSGMAKNSIKSFRNSLEAGLFLKNILRPGDIVLVKGSQNNVRMEIAIEQIMAHPELKRKTLVRQSDFWNELR